DLAAANVTGLKIQSKTDTISLAKTGDSWVLANHGDYPVDTVKVTDLISKVLSIATARLVARTASSHNRLQVADDEYVTKVDLATSQGVTKTLILGTSPSARATNVRLAGDDLVYLANDLQVSSIRTDVGGWVDLVYFQVPTADAQAVTIENSHGKLDFTRVNTDTWTLSDLGNGEIFNNNNFTTVLSRLGGLNMVAPVGKEVKPEYGLEPPAATVTVVTKPAEGEAKTTTFTIGAKDEGGTNYYAKSSDSDYVVKIAPFTGDQFINDTRDRYLQPPPTPEASSTLTGTQGLTSVVPITSFSALTSTGAFSSVAPVTATVEAPASALTTTESVTTTQRTQEESPLATPTPRS
ncbi:MAG TPA: DUF4340 domain-containing protein, partial [Caldilineaceae bacterium]|nr:DUF4340 domain-containing protein [Caldilineaceae bacterium]